MPILTKRLIRKNFTRLRAYNIPGYVMQTSGSVSRSKTFKDKRLRYDFGEERFKSWYKTSKKTICYLLAGRYQTPIEKRRFLYLPDEPLRNREVALDYLELTRNSGKIMPSQTISRTPCKFVL